MRHVDNGLIADYSQTRVEETMRETAQNFYYASPLHDGVRFIRCSPLVQKEDRDEQGYSENLQPAPPHSALPWYYPMATHMLYIL